MIKMPTESNPVTVVCGDSLALLPELSLSAIAALVSDPPYGMDWDTDSARFTGGQGHHHKKSKRVAGDDMPFDPTPWLTVPKVVFWGANHYGAALPTGTTLVWLKKSAEKYGVFLSDAEIGWMKGGHGVYAFSHIWDGCARQSEHGEHYHPTQKPVALMRWCIRRLNLKPGSLIIDPFAGSGSTAVAAVFEGMRCIVIEQDPAYCEVINRRVRQVTDEGLFAGLANDQPDLFSEAM